ncbi:7,8-dihydropterin-6-yl-methyl-4-(beta-D-ribofuranosyl)aminobenzene 5'-phosphate synthase [Pseudobutyrivibrio sp. YE44]|uniref:MBL fold metallo-hydrolase n=1 Tax=Pseudobutyrivibrio sp. YE44 TaxID=1520802 RepID=UPI00088642C6|nr:MBL fold metallo-hydrolase [Pseudobutyrivibrio sp. YE44]SDB31195.1 7,8-dihydropterin-6-yl-methyl-4-(beta-D-ribofuranosyl)aminobenzene 5'-phosphate synthase [Pseudobutyrivibrio sp. YE44]
MKTKLTVIVDNIPDGELQGEWGLSILVEYGNKKILLDTGSTDLFAENLQKLGFDIKGIDYGVLSHAHYDHANGIPRFFQENSKAKFYMRESVAPDCYHMGWFSKKYIGIPKNLITDYSDRIHLVRGDYELCDGVYLIPHKTARLAWIGRSEMMYRKNDHGTKPDDFSHEQSLVLDTDTGLVILNSCSHGGAVNIINEVQRTFPNKHVYALVGGLHLFNKRDREVERTAESISRTGINQIYTGHCTKDRAYEIMKAEFGNRIHQFKVGMVMEF